MAAIRARRIGRIIPVDSAITFHRIVGHAMFAFALLHTAAQVVSYYTKAPDAFLSQLLSRGMGQTGIALILVFAVMWVFSLSIVRRTKHFELFYFTHLLYFAWVILMVLHTPKYLIFAGIPLVLFFSELVWRIKRRRPLAKVLFADALRSGVTKLEIEKPAGFTYQAGDYVFVNVPQIANHEWHPFTLSSAPENPNLSIHIRSLGNWSSAIRSLVQRNPKPSDIKVHLDGPFGTPSARIFAARNVVLIGAGIGVTPFASVLESIYLKTVKRDQSSQHSLQKVHFFWINRDQYSFEWFRQLLTNIEHNDPSHVFEFNIFMTGAKSGGTALGFELAREAQRQAGKTDVITGLRATTVAGHPDWEKELTRIRDQHGQEKVEVFFCGPRGLGTKLRPLCRSLGLAFHEERF